MVDADLEGIVAKHLADAYQPKLARCHKVLIGATRSVVGVHNGFASAEDTMLGDDGVTSLNDVARVGLG